MSRVKKLLLGTIALFFIFCIYWAIGRTAIVSSLTSEIKDLQNDGYAVVHKGIAVGGFPLHFRAQLTEPDIASPRHTETPWSIKSEKLSLTAFSFNPFQWTAKHRGDARLDIRSPGGERWLFDARPFIIDFNTRISFTGNLKAVKATLFRLKFQAVIGTLPPIIALDSAVVDVSPNNNDMQINWELKNTFLNQGTLKELQKAFGPRVELIEGQALAIGLNSLGSDKINNWKKTGQISCEDWRVIWGDIVFEGGFNLIQSSQGPSGTVRLQVNDIPQLIQTLEGAGILTQEQAYKANMSAILLPVNKNGVKELNINLQDGFLTLFGQKIYAFK